MFHLWWLYGMDGTGILGSSLFISVSVCVCVWVWSIMVCSIYIYILLVDDFMKALENDSRFFLFSFWLVGLSSRAWFVAVDSGFCEQPKKKHKYDIWCDTHRVDRLWWCTWLSCRHTTFRNALELSRYMWIAFFSLTDHRRNLTYLYIQYAGEQKHKIQTPNNNPNQKCISNYVWFSARAHAAIRGWEFDEIWSNQKTINLTIIWFGNEYWFSDFGSIIYSFYSYEACLVFSWKYFNLWFKYIKFNWNSTFTDGDAKLPHSRTQLC